MLHLLPPPSPTATAHPARQRGLSLCLPQHPPRRAACSRAADMALWLWKGPARPLQPGLELGSLLEDTAQPAPFPGSPFSGSPFSALEQPQTAARSQPDDGDT